MKEELGYISDIEYDNIYSKVPRLCVDLVIKNSNGVLLIKRKTQPYKNKYHLAGGRVRFRETIADAVNRVAISELGVNVSVVKMVGFMEFIREVQGNSKRHSISIVFNVKPSKEPINGIYFKKQSNSIHSIHNKFLIENKLIKK